MAHPTTIVSCFYYLVILGVLSSSPRVVLSASDEKIEGERSPVFEAGFTPLEFESVKDSSPAASSIRSGRSPRLHARAYRPSHARRYSNVDQDDLLETKPKSYAFAYAVKDGQNGDDFSHKERREGKKTIGEYSVLLPDGRTQVVRYTSDSKEGFRADVTYESGSEPQTKSSPTPKPVSRPFHYQPAGSVATSPQLQIGSPSYTSSSSIDGRIYSGRVSPTVPVYESDFSSARLPASSPSRVTAITSGNDVGDDEPVFLSFPLKARPSLSPSLIYKSSGGSIRSEYATATPSTLIYSREPSSPYKGLSRASPATFSRPSQSPYSSGSGGPTSSPYPGPSANTITVVGPTSSSYSIVGPTSSSYSSGPISSSSYSSGPTASSSYSSGPTSPSYPVGPSPTAYTSGPVVISKASPYRSSPKYYPSPSPNSLYDSQPVTPKYSLQRAQKVIGTHYTKAGAIPPTAVSSPYRAIMRGERAGPYGTGTFIKSVPAPPPVTKEPRQIPVTIIRRGPSVSPYHAQPSEQVSEQYSHSGRTFSHSKTNHKNLLPVEYFKAGPATEGTLLGEQSVSQIYTPVGSTVSTPVGARQTQTYFESQNAISAADDFSGVTPKLLGEEEGETLYPLTQSEEIYLSQLEHQGGLRLSPVKSSVATYTTKFLGITPKPDLFESQSNPGIPVGRAVQPSVSGLTYVDTRDSSTSGSRGPHTHKLGVKEALSRLPSLTIPTTKTYEVGAPDFGSSVSYSAGKKEEEKNIKKIFQQGPLYREAPSNHLSLHNGFLREYVVEKKVGVTPSYEAELN